MIADPARGQMRTYLHNVAFIQPAHRGFELPVRRNESHELYLAAFRERSPADSTRVQRDNRSTPLTSPFPRLTVAGWAGPLSRI